jgi:disulfide bond formation protein DsbB
MKPAPSLALCHSPGLIALLAGIGSAALLAGAWWFELGLGLRPCKLCLEQRLPHYVALPVALFGTVLWRQGRGRLAMLALGALVLTYLVSAGLGAYHAGVEWGWFAGPNDCGGAVSLGAGGVGDFLRQLETVRVVSCTQAAWRLFGLSLAGWNALASLALAGLVFAGLRGGKAYSSSSLRA